MGHAEGLLELVDQSSNNLSHWRYAPFTTMLGVSSPKDFVSLPSPESIRGENKEGIAQTEALTPVTDSDFSFVWSIGFSTSSTLKLGVPMLVANQVVQAPSTNQTAFEAAQQKDNADWWSASRAAWCLLERLT